MEHNEEKEDFKSRIIADFLSANYLPIGSVIDQVYKTSVDLAYDMSEMINIQATDVAKALISSGYQTKYISGQPYWVMYEKNKPDF